MEKRLLIGLHVNLLELSEKETDPMARNTRSTTMTRAKTNKRKLMQHACKNINNDDRMEGRTINLHSSAPSGAQESPSHEGTLLADLNLMWLRRTQLLWRCHGDHGGRYGWVVEETKSLLAISLKTMNHINPHVLRGLCYLSGDLDTSRCSKSTCKINKMRP